MKPEYELNILKRMNNGDLLLQLGKNKYVKGNDGTLKVTQFNSMNIPLTKLYEVLNTLSPQLKQFQDKDQEKKVVKNEKK